MGFLPDHRAERFAGRLTKLPVVGHTAAEFWRSAWIYRRRQKSVALVMLLACGGTGRFRRCLLLLARALWSPDLGPMPSLLEHFLLVPIGLVVQTLMPTPGGAGGGEWGFAALYLLFRAAETNGVLGSLVKRMLEWVIGLACYGVYLWMRPAQTAAGEERAAVLVELPLPAASQSALAG